MENVDPKNKVVINSSKMNDVQSVFQCTGVECTSFYQVLISWPVVQANTEDSKIQYMMLTNDILGLMLLHLYSLAHKLFVTSLCYFML